MVNDAVLRDMYIQQIYRSVRSKNRFQICFPTFVPHRHRNWGSLPFTGLGSIGRLQRRCGIVGIGRLGWPRSGCAHPYMSLLLLKLPLYCLLLRICQIGSYEKNILSKICHIVFSNNHATEIPQTCTSNLLVRLSNIMS